VPTWKVELIPEAVEDFQGLDGRNELGLFMKKLEMSLRLLLSIRGKTWRSIELQ